MALQKGDAACTTGLAKRIRDNLYATTDVHGMPPDLHAAYCAGLCVVAYAIACAVVDEIQAHGEAVQNPNHTYPLR